MPKTVNAICKQTIKVKKSYKISGMNFSSWEFWVCVFAPDTLCRKGLRKHHLLRLRTTVWLGRTYSKLMDGEVGGVATLFNSQIVELFYKYFQVKIVILKTWKRKIRQSRQTVILTELLCYHGGYQSGFMLHFSKYSS